MTNKASQAGFYILRSLKIRPLISNSPAGELDYVEMSKTIVNWNISESINSPFISGSVTILESDNILEDLPILGEEEIEITYTDYYDETITQKFFIYAVEDIKPGNSINDRMVMYTIKFCTQQKLNSDTKEIRKSFGNTKISDMVKSIYEEHFITGNKSVDKEIEVEETDGEQTVVIPNLRPDAAIQFLSRRAYSATNKSSLYRFFETREKYYFCTHEYLISKYADFEGISDDLRNRLFFIYNTVDDNTGPGQRIAQQSVNDITYGTKVDTMSDMKEGTYRRTVTELDFGHRTRITRTYDYTDDYENFKAPDPVKLTHSSSFVNNYMGASQAPETILMTDFPQIGMNEGQNNQRRPYQHYYENYTTKPIIDYHMNRNAFPITINGRHGLYPGMIINLELYKFSNTLAGTREIDRERSGKYIIMSINNVFNGDEYKQSLTITKGGLAK